MGLLGAAVTYFPISCFLRPTLLPAVPVWKAGVPFDLGWGVIFIRSLTRSIVICCMEMTSASGCAEPGLGEWDMIKRELGCVVRILVIKA